MHLCSISQPFSTYFDHFRSQNPTKAFRELSSESEYDVLFYFQEHKGSPK